MISLICFCLTSLGCINWLSIGIIQFDFIAAIFGSQAHVVSRILYVLVGLSCIWLIVKAFKNKGTIDVRHDNLAKKEKTQDMLS